MRQIVEVDMPIIYDSGYGEIDATLVCDVEVKYVFGSFFCKIQEGTIFKIDQDGGNMGEVPYEDDCYDEQLRELAIEQVKVTAAAPQLLEASERAYSELIRLGDDGSAFARLMLRSAIEKAGRKL